MPRVVRELRRIVLPLLQPSANVDGDRSTQLPRNTKMLLKQVMFNMDAVANAADVDGSIFMYLYNGTSPTKTFNADRLLITINSQQLTAGAQPSDKWGVQPVIWDPPPGLYLYAPFITASLHTNGLTNALEGSVIMYGTFIEMSELEFAQKVVGL